MTAKMAQNKFVPAKHKLYCFIAFTTFSVGIIIFTIPVKQAKQTQAGFCFIIFQGLMTNCYQDYHISNPLQLCIKITQINSKQKTAVK